MSHVRCELLSGKAVSIKPSLHMTQLFLVSTYTEIPSLNDSLLCLRLVPQELLEIREARKGSKIGEG